MTYLQFGVRIDGWFKLCIFLHQCLDDLRQIWGMRANSLSTVKFCPHMGAIPQLNFQFFSKTQWIRYTARVRSHRKADGLSSLLEKHPNIKHGEASVYVSSQSGHKLEHLIQSGHITIQSSGELRKTLWESDFMYPHHQEPHFLPHVHFY